MRRTRCQYIHKTVISSIHCALSRLRIKWTRALHRAWQCDRVVVTKVKPIWIAQSLPSLSLSCNSSIQTIKSSSNLANRIIAPHLILAINSLSSSTPRHTLDSHRRFVDKRKSLQWTCAFYLLSDLLSPMCTSLRACSLLLLQSQYLHLLLPRSEIINDPMSSIVSFTALQPFAGRCRVSAQAKLSPIKCSIFVINWSSSTRSWDWVRFFF